MNKTIIMRVLFLITTLVFSCFFNIAQAQSIPSDLDSLSDLQLQEYWNKAKSQGFTMAQIKSLALAKGVPSIQVAEFERRLGSLNTAANVSEVAQIDNALEVSNATTLGNNGNIILSGSETKSNIFGLDFFNNKNISFTPNLNVATPESYELGPGDEISINIWGAAENNYVVIIDREGVLRIPNIGPVFVNGMPISKANSLIISKLKRVYAGINAPDNSPYKVFVSTSLAKVRSVQIDITGEVQVPGTYTLNSLSTVLNGLYAAGGPTSKGTLREVKLVRNGQPPIYFDIYKYLIEGSQNGNVNLKDQDLIIVSPYLSKIYISGAVKRPGIFELKKNENFGDLLKYVSGFNDNAYKDKITLERIKGDGRVLKEIDFDVILNAQLESGDRIKVKAISDRIANTISIQGAVNRPGDYEFSQGLTLKELIKKASGLKPNFLGERAVIHRENEDLTMTFLSFSLDELLSGSKNMLLQENDRVRIFNLNDANANASVSIKGAVKSPGAFNFQNGMSIQDLVLLAGGFTDKANTGIIDVYRKINDDEFETLTESFRLSLNNNFSFNENTHFEINAGDRISVRNLKGINDKVNVKLIGELNLPGDYSSQTRGERISDFIKKAGGVSPYAFVEGATLIRLNPFYKEEAQKLTSDVINEQSTNVASLSNRKEFRVGIDLKAILSGDSKNATKADMVLKDGDRIIIPSIKETVKTEGQITIPSLIRHEKGLSFKNYINKSGGFGERALRRKSYVVYPNGDIAATTNFLFFKSYPKVTAGSIVIVPKKAPRGEGVNVQEAIGVTSGLATLALLIDRITRD